MGHIHRTPHLAHWFYYRLLVAPTFQTDSLALTIYSYTGYPVSAFYKLVNAFGYLSIHNLYHVKIIILAYACEVMFYFSFILSYMLSTFRKLTHTCATSSRDVGLGSQHPNHA